MKSIRTGRVRKSRVARRMEPDQNGTRDRPDLAPARGWSRTVQRLLLAATFLPVIMALVVVLIFRDDLEDLHTVGYFGIFVANVVGSGTFILPVPGITTVILGATLWHPFLVAVAGGTGATVGEVAGYLAGVGSYGVIRRIIGGNRWYARIRGWIEARGTVTIFLFAATPNPLFDVAGFAAGSLRYPIGRFLTACWLGKMVKYSVVSYASYWGANVLYSWFD